MAEKTNLLGAIIALIFFLSTIMVFVFRLIDKPKVEYGFGIVVISLILPSIYLLIKAPKLERPFIYYVQLGVDVLFK